MVPLRQRDMCKKSPYNGSDYQSVKIPGFRNSLRVHRIVCETFHGKAPKGKNIVKHADNVKSNNSADNVSWGTPSENMLEFSKTHKLVRHPIATIKTVKRLINRGWTNDRIAQKLKMSDSNVSSIKLGKTHDDVQPYTLEQWL